MLNRPAIPIALILALGAGAGAFVLASGITQRTQTRADGSPSAPPSSTAGPFEDGVAAAKRGDYAAAMHIFRSLADQGVAAGQNGVGLMYRNGQGVPQNYAEGMKWYRMAADQGYAAAQNNLGNMYANGQGVPQNYEEALKWFRKAADQGYAAAQNNLGVMYANGRGVPQNYDEAVKWYRRAADLGNARAQANLGFKYENGQARAGSTPPPLQNSLTRIKIGSNFIAANGCRDNLQTFTALIPNSERLDMSYQGVLAGIEAVETAGNNMRRDFHGYQNFRFINGGTAISYELFAKGALVPRGFCRAPGYGGKQGIDVYAHYK